MLDACNYDRKSRSRPVLSYSVLSFHRIMAHQNEYKTQHPYVQLSASPLAKFPRPVLEFFEPLFAHTGSDVHQTGFEVLHPNGADFVGGHVEETFAEGTEGTHGGVFGEGGDIGARETCHIICQ